MYAWITRIVSRVPTDESDEQRDIRDRVDENERRLEALEQRLRLVELRTGGDVATDG